MREKIMTLTVCITLVYWLGGLAGCATSPRDAQNEDMLKEDKSIFDTSPPAGGGNQFQTQSHPHVNVMLAAMQPAETVTEVVDVPVEIATAPAAPVNDTGISVTGIDRSSWQKIDVSPRYGRVKHSSTYFSDQPGRVYTHTTVNLDGLLSDLYRLFLHRFAQFSTASAYSAIFLIRRRATARAPAPASLTKKAPAAVELLVAAAAGQLDALEPYP